MKKGMKVIDARAMPHCKTKEDFIAAVQNASVRKVAVINNVSRGNAYVSFAHDVATHTFTQIALSDLKPVIGLKDVYLDDCFGMYPQLTNEKAV